MKKVLTLCCEQSYIDFAQISVSSFLAHNKGWEVIVADIGLDLSSRTYFENLGVKIKQYPYEPVGSTGLNHYYPATQARCLLFGEIPDENTLMLYLDVDCVVMGSVEELVDGFLKSQKPIAIGEENDPVRFHYAEARSGWKHNEAPECFVNREKWHHNRILNTGVFLAYGKDAKEMGARVVELYPSTHHLYAHAEQTVISSVIYDGFYPIHYLNWSQHCFQLEHFVTKTGVPYVDPVYLDDMQVLIRHWCGIGSKKNARRDYLDILRVHYGLPSLLKKPIPPQLRFHYKTTML
jgi:lipopolysaccharide biosynthesis glycosyltransferase